MLAQYGWQSITTMHPLNRGFGLRYWKLALVLQAIAFHCACSRAPADSRSAGEACADLAKVVASQGSTFLARAQEIRGQHILLLDYDRQMIAALNQRREALESTKLTEVNDDSSVSGCSGQPLKELQVQARQELNSLMQYLETFKRAVRQDPDGVYLDQP